MHTYLHSTRESKLLEMGDELQNTGNNSCVSCLDSDACGSQVMFTHRLVHLLGVLNG